MPQNAESRARPRLRLPDPDQRRRVAAVAAVAAVVVLVAVGPRVGGAPPAVPDGRPLRATDDRTTDTSAAALPEIAESASAGPEATEPVLLERETTGADPAAEPPTSMPRERSATPPAREDAAPRAAASSRVVRRRPATPHRRPRARRTPPGPRRASRNGTVKRAARTAERAAADASGPRSGSGGPTPTPTPQRRRPPTAGHRGTRPGTADREFGP